MHCGQISLNFPTISSQERTDLFYKKVEQPLGVFDQIPDFINKEYCLYEL